MLFKISPVQYADLFAIVFQIWAGLLPGALPSHSIVLRIANVTRHAALRASCKLSGSLKERCGNAFHASGLMKGSGLLIVSGLLPHENKRGVLNLAVKVFGVKFSIKHS